MAISKATITASMRSSGMASVIPRNIVSSKPDFCCGISTVKARVFSCRMGPMTEVLQNIRKFKPTIIDQVGSIAINIAKDPFSGEGTFRWPFYARLHNGKVGSCTIGLGSSANLVAKRFKDPMSTASKRVDPAVTHAKRKYEDQMEVQAVAACMAVAFNNDCRCASPL